MALAIKRDASISKMPESDRHFNYQTTAVISIKEEVECKTELQRGQIAFLLSSDRPAPETPGAMEG